MHESIQTHWRMSYEPELGDPVTWKLEYFPDLGTSLSKGFAISDGIWSIGYNISGIPVAAKNLYPDDQKEMNLLLDRKMAELEQIYKALHPPKKDKQK